MLKNNKINKQHRFDRFYYSNLTIKNFNTWTSENSEHALMETDIYFGKTLVNSVSTKLDKNKTEEIKLKNRNNISSYILYKQ